MSSKFQKFFFKLNYVKVFKISMLMVVFGIIFGFFAFPKILKFIMKSQLQLKPGTQMREMFTEIPFPLDFKVYLFNVTNTNEVMAGGKPKLQEVGPYYFEEWKVKYNLVDDDAEDTLEYDYKNTFIYKPKKNGAGLTGDEIITVAHPITLGMALTVNVDREELLPFISNAINGILHHPKDIFWTGRAMDILFDGIPLDCSSEDFEVSAACSEFASGEHKSIQPLNETAFQFSMFGGANATSLGRFTVLRGSKNIKDLGRVLKFNGEPEMDVWFGDECNQFHGTDSTIFPPFTKKEDGIWAFEPLLCRSMAIQYQHPSKYAGIKANFYTLDFGDISSDPKLHCFCRNPEKCPIQGTYDLFPCMGSPLIATLPHFYNTHPSVIEKIASGLNPEEAKHATTVDFHQFSGSPLTGAKRLQLSFDVVPLEDVPVMKDLQSMYFPLLWLEEGVQLNKTFTNMIKYQLILALQFQDTVKFGCIFGGIFGIIGAGAAYYMQSEEENNKTIPVKSTKKVKSASIQSGVEIINNSLY